MVSLNFYVSCNLYFNILDLEIVSSNYYIDFQNNIWIYDLNLKAIHSFTLWYYHFHCSHFLFLFGSLLHFQSVPCFWIFAIQFLIKIIFYSYFYSLIKCFTIIIILCFHHNKIFLFFQVFCCFIKLIFFHDQLFNTKIQVLIIPTMIFSNSIYDMNDLICHSNAHSLKS